MGKRPPLGVEPGLVGSPIKSGDVVQRSGRNLGPSAVAGPRQRMWPVYRRAIGTAVGDRLSAAEAMQLADLLGRLL